MSQISVQNFPTNFLVPGVYLTVDASQANTATTPKRTLLVGQQISSSPTTQGVPTGGIPPLTSLGTLQANVPTIAGSVTDVQKMAGHGSHLALMYAAYRKVDPLGEVWLLPLNDDSTSTVANGNVLISGTATSSGVIFLYIGGQLVQVPVSAGDTRSVIGISTFNAINSSSDLPVYAYGVSDSTQMSQFTVGVSSKNHGALNNDVDMRLNFQQQNTGQVLPPGVTVTFAPVSGALVNPSLTSGFSNLSSQPYDYICCPYFDSTTFSSINSLLNDQSGRWSPTQEIFGHAFSAYRGSIGQRTTVFSGINNQHLSAIGFFDSPTTVWEWAASLTAAAAVSANEDPALPITGYILPVFAPPMPSQDTIGERNTLLLDGCSTYKVNSANQVVLERVVTTYTTNPATGAPDNSYQDAETLFTLMAVIRDFRIQLQTQFARKKLVADGTPIPGGSSMVTSQTVLAAAISRYRTQANVFGWVQNPAQFAKAAIGQNAGGGQVRLFLPVQIANQLRQIVANVQFTKP